MSRGQLDEHMAGLTSKTRHRSALHLPDQAHADRLPMHAGRSSFQDGGTDASWRCCALVAIQLLSHKAVPISTAATWKSPCVNVSHGPPLAPQSVPEPPHSWDTCRGMYQLVSSTSSALRKKQIYGDLHRHRSSVFVQPW